MSSPYPFAPSFRKPQTNLMLSPTFGLPRGTFGRGIYAPVAIVLHSLRVTFEAYDAQETESQVRTKAELRHPSVHYAIGVGGECHQYVNDADVAWGLWDYAMSDFPAAYPPGPWPLPYPVISPDWYVLHVALVSGDETTVLTPAMLQMTAMLLAWLCHTYTITADVSHIITHEQIDAQFEHVCAGDDFPLASILAATQAIIANGGEPWDPLFNNWIFLTQYFGPFIVGLSRINGPSWIVKDTP